MVFTGDNVFEEAVETYRKLNEFVENIHKLQNSIYLLTCEPVMELKKAVDKWNKQWDQIRELKLNELLKPENLIQPRVQHQIIRVEVTIKRD